MFDLAWSEIGLIVAVAIIVIGPKDLPDAIRTVARGVGKLRRMAGEFQGHLDEVVREAKLEDVRDQIRDIRNFDLKGEVERAVDKDGSLRDGFRDDPFRAPSSAAPGAGAAAASAMSPIPAGAPDAEPALAGPLASDGAVASDPFRAAPMTPSADLAPAATARAVGEEAAFAAASAASAAPAPTDATGGAPPPLSSASDPFRAAPRHVSI